MVIKSIVVFTLPMYSVCGFLFWAKEIRFMVVINISPIKLIMNNLFVNIRDIIIHPANSLSAIVSNLAPISDVKLNFLAIKPSSISVIDATVIKTIDDFKLSISER